MNNWQPVDYMILLLVVTVCVFFGAMIYNSVIQHAQLSEAKSKAFAAFLSSVVAIISMYVGAAIQKSKNKGD